MKEKEFRNLLSKAKSGKLSLKENELLDQFVASKSEKELADDVNILDSKQKVLTNTLAAIRFQKRKYKLQTAYKYAASILLLFTIGYSLIIITNQNTKTERFASYIEVFNERGERKTITLPDSSTIILNGNSYCKYPDIFPEKQRLIQLKGEAFFKVKRNENKPFIVESTDLTTTVLGTSFNIKEEGSTVTVTVSTGRVKVESKNYKETTILTKNQQYVYNYQKAEGILTTVDAERFSNWSHGILQFNDSNFEEVILVLEEWYDVEITYSSKSLKNRTIKGIYKEKSLDYILNDMEFMLDINYKIKGDTVFLSNK